MPVANHGPVKVEICHLFHRRLKQIIFRPDVILTAGSPFDTKYSSRRRHGGHDDRRPNTDGRTCEPIIAASEFFVGNLRGIRPASVSFECPHCHPPTCKSSESSFVLGVFLRRPVNSVHIHPKIVASDSGGAIRRTRPAYRPSVVGPSNGSGSSASPPVERAGLGREPLVGQALAAQSLLTVSSDGSHKQRFRQQVPIHGAHARCVVVAVGRLFRSHSRMFCPDHPFSGMESASRSGCAQRRRKNEEIGSCVDGFARHRSVRKRGHVT